MIKFRPDKFLYYWRFYFAYIPAERFARSLYEGFGIKRKSWSFIYKIWWNLTEKKRGGRI